MKLKRTTPIRIVPSTNLPCARTSGCHPNPAGVAQLPDHPWEAEEVSRLWHRPGTQRGVVEIVIETAGGKRILGSLKQLPGFYESGVQRIGKKLKI